MLPETYGLSGITHHSLIFIELATPLTPHCQSHYLRNEAPMPRLPHYELPSLMFARYYIVQ